MKAVSHGFDSLGEAVRVRKQKKKSTFFRSAPRWEFFPDEVGEDTFDELTSGDSIDKKMRDYQSTTMSEKIKFGPKEEEEKSFRLKPLEN